MSSICMLFEIGSEYRIIVDDVSHLYFVFPI